MALVIADRVRETTTTTGTGAVTLAGAYTSFQSFLAAVGNGNSTYYTIASAVTGEWEVGIGTYTSASNTLSRTTVLASSNAGSLVNFSSGAKDVFVTQPAERSILVQSAGSGLFSGVAAFTANGVPYANSTSTLTTGSALTFDGTNLAAAGRVRAGGTSALGLSNVFEAQNTSYGNLAAFRSIPGDGINPYLLITSSADGITLEENGSAYGALMFKTNASEQMRLTGTGLGIGASSFSSKLSVQTTDASAWSPNSTTGTQFIYNAGVLNSASATTHYQVIYGDATTGGVKAGAVASASYSADFVIANRNVGTYQENLRLTYNGNLGIGTSSPNKGSWSKALTLEGASNEAYELVTNGTYMGWFAAGGSSVTIGTKQANPFIFFTSDTERMRLDSSGNLGIGTSSPATKLQVAGEIRSSSDISNSSDPVIYSYNGGSAGSVRSGIQLIGSTQEFRIYTAGSNRLSVDSSGNLGLGVTPSAWTTYTAQQIRNASVYGWSGGNSFAALAANTWYGGSPAGYRYISTDFATEYYQYQGAHVWRTAASGTAGNAITFTQAMTLDASGNLGIGTTSPQGQLSLGSAASGQKGLTLDWTGTGGPYAVASFTADRSTGEIRNFAYTNFFQTWYSNNTEKMRLDTSGNLGIGTSSPSAKLTVTDTNGIALRLGDISAAPVNQTAVYVGPATTALSGAINGDLVLIPRTSTTASITFWTGSTTAAERMRLDSSGNLGLGVTPSASWFSGSRVFQFGATGALWTNGSNNTAVSHNAIFGDSTTTYQTTGAASYYRLFNGAHNWFNAPSGTAGNAITFTQAMTLDSSGRLFVGTTTLQSTFEVLTLAGSNSTANDITLYGPSTSQLRLQFSKSGAAGQGEVGYNMATDAMRFVTSGTERARIDSSGNLIQSAPTTAPTLSTNGTMVFNLTSNTNLRVSVRGSDGVTRTANITLA